MQRIDVTLRALSVFACVVCVLLLVGSTSIAQISLPNPFGVSQDLAVRAALASFGKAVGAQLPITLSTSDAYPTAALPGAPFIPRAAPNVVAELRASKDGTVALPPGDYAFTVDVFCMQAHAGSPNAHRYLVAPLRGSAADIFEALNSRTPSFSLDHHALQMLSWNIQAGIPYGEMRPAQRSIVDRVIPDFRPRLQGDIYTRIRGQFDQVASKVPGMPSFEAALGRIGSVGQTVLAMQRLREELAQPPPTFEELARQLVPFMPLERSGGGETPWSRYSDRVYVRFVTAGNYASPGTYQVRVLPAQQVSSTRLIGLGAPGAAAPVPMSNVVNNPGTSSVQPLTQAPQPGSPQNPGPAPTPTSTPTASITSETYATEPADRTRLTVGVGEQVKLIFSAGDAHWSISGGKGKVTPTGHTSFYSASITPATETIVAIDTTTKATAMITFTVIAPSGLFFEIVPSAKIHHRQHWPDTGFTSNVFLQPETVSFEYIEVRERDSTFQATGYYHWMNGQSHSPSTKPENITSLVPGKGWQLENQDDVWTGRQNFPFEPGYETVDIPWEYTAAGHNGPYYLFAHVTQRCEFQNDRSTLTAVKGNASLMITISSPDQ